MEKMENELKVGDRVGVKYDVEQTGTIEAIRRNHFGCKVFDVRVFQGEYVMDRHVGAITTCSFDELF